VTIWVFLACVLGSALGTVVVLAAALAILFWLDEQPRTLPGPNPEDARWYHMLDGRRN